MPPVYDVIVIGSGPAGLTAAIYATRAALKTLVIAGTTAGGQLMITTDVENYPGFPSGVQGPELMELWRKQAERFKADFVDDNVSKVDFTKRPLIVWTSDETHEARSVIIATRANARYLGLPNEERLKGRRPQGPLPIPRHRAFSRHGGVPRSVEARERLHRPPARRWPCDGHVGRGRLCGGRRPRLPVSASGDGCGFRFDGGSRCGTMARVARLSTAKS